MSQTYKQTNDAEGDKNECCICYNDNSEESNEGKLIECCPNKHILCVGCFHKSYERKCECPLCRELMFNPEIMTDVEAFAYYGAKVALNDRRAREEQQRQFRLAEAERQRAIVERQREIQRVEEERQRQEAEMRRQQQLELIQVRKTERIQRIQVRNVELLVQRDEILGQIAINNAEIENINNLDLDAYYAMYSPYEVQPRALQPTNLIDSDSDSDTDDDSVEIIYESQPRPERIIVTPGGIATILNQLPARPAQIHPVARPVQQPVARPVQQPVARPVQQPVARPLTMHERERMLQPVARPVQQPVQIQLLGRPVEQPPRQERRSPNYAREKLRQDEILVQTLNSHRMFLRYDRLNDRFIGADNRVYPTLNSASGAHALEMRLSYTPNAWKTFKRSDGSRIDNL
jgi:hypothetical protein